MANILQEYYNTGNDDSDNEGGSSGALQVAQTFDAVGVHTIYSVKLLLHRTFTPGTITVSIRFAPVQNKPTDTDLCYETFDGDTLGTSSPGEWIEIVFASPITTVDGTRYAIVVKSESTYYNWAQDDSSPTYSSGNMLRSIDSGSNWTHYFGTDNMFEVWGEAVSPSKPINPTPANGAVGVDFSGLVLDWDSGGNTSTFDVYIGPSGNLAQVASAITPSTYTVNIGDVPTEQVIYWRIDATNINETTAGDIWNFDARPVKAVTPSPPDAASDITLDETPLSWVDGGNTDTYEIYWRIQGDDWVLVGVAQAGVEWTIDFGTLAYGVTYEWRIDATNTAGTTTGDTWSFSSISFGQIRVSYRLISGGNGQGPYDSPPGVQGTDWEYTGESNMITVRKLIAAANNKIWHEDI